MVLVVNAEKPENCFRDTLTVCGDSSSVRFLPGAGLALSRGGVCSVIRGWSISYLLWQELEEIVAKCYGVSAV